MSHLYLDVEYAKRLGLNLERFVVKQTVPFQAKCRCPICGDSKSNKSKSRGYMLEYKSSVIFKCHNCGYSASLSKFIKQINPSLYDMYMMDIIKDKNSLKKPEKIPKFEPDMSLFSSKRIDKFDMFKNVKRVSQLDWQHPAKKYVVSRKIPSDKHHRIYYVPLYSNWVNDDILPGKFSQKALENDEPRLVFPLIDEKGYVFGVTGRSLKPKSEFRYSTIIMDSNAEKVFGLDVIDKTKTIYLVEGPIDSLFLDNCLAMAGADINFSAITKDRDKLVVVYDNEPRNKEIVSKIKKAINNQLKVCIWPSNILEKDINDIIISGKTSSEIMHIIDKNTFEGLSGIARLAQWNKVR